MKFLLLIAVLFNLSGIVIVLSSSDISAGNLSALLLIGFGLAVLMNGIFKSRRIKVQINQE